MSIPPIALAPLAPLPPPNYTSLNDDTVQSAISFGYSHYNPRGLEKAWNAAWAATLHGLVSPFKGSFLVHPAYPLWISATDATEMELRRGFDAAGLDFDDVQMQSLPVQEIQVDKPDLMDLDGPRKSHRVRVMQRRADREEVRKRTVQRNALLAGRNQLMDQELDNLDYPIHQDGISEKSVASRAT
ncbi:hypothetical protein BD779DRAFT_1682904 [Infundibulicybe gibba]|nr:hypothetical protein BD779DRAFT_1682904 [Infundibulicybe gibba]